MIRRFLTSLIFVFVFIFHVAAETATIRYDTENYGVITDDILIAEVVTLKNFGTIRGNIDVGVANEFTFQNSGIFDGIIYLDSRAELIQRITAQNEIQKLNVTGPGRFASVDVSGLNGANFMDLARVAAHAEQLKISNSTLCITLGDDTHTPILFSGGHNTLLVSGIPELGTEFLLLSGVTVNSVIILEPENPNEMYYFTPRYDGSNLFLTVVRNTDYSWIFNNRKYVDFINSFRARNSAAAARIDNAPDMKSLSRVMNEYYEFNPSLLFDSMKLLNAMTDFDAQDIGAVAIINSDTQIYDAYAGMTHKNFSFGINYGTLNDTRFSGQFYGAALRGKIVSGNVFAGISINANRVQFETEPVWDKKNETTTTNPAGWIYGGVLEFGGIMRPQKSFNISPFIRVRTDVTQILDTSSTETNFGVGFRANYETDVSGMKSRYGVIAYAESELMRAGILLEFSPKYDGVSVGINTGAINYNNELFWYGNVGLSVYF